MIEPGHRGLMFDPKRGLQHQVLGPGYYRLSSAARIDDYDVTYSTRTETIKAVTSEGLVADLRFGVVYRPIISELYLLDTEIGPNYYDEVVGLEFRSAARGVVARHSFVDFLRRDGHHAFEDEIEADARRRIQGRHIELASVALENLELPPEVMAAVRTHQVAAQNAARDEAERAREKAEAQEKWEAEKVELEHEVERRKLQREAGGAGNEP
jgi:regulator of protease activity HflC (stomatin/prohibitin superfamily)